MPSDRPDASPPRSNGRHAADVHPHVHRLAIADRDFAAAGTIDLATASRADMALAYEQLRSAFMVLRAMEREHHAQQ